MLEVVAIRDGHYGRLRRPGDTFTLASEKHLSKRWMRAKGTPEYDAFLRTGPAAPDEHDKLTGERLSAGGMAEQLSYAIEENARKDQRIAELEAELKIARADASAPAPAPVEPLNEAQSEKGEEADEARGKPVRRRRRKEE